MSKYRVQLDRDVQGAAQKSATKNGRSLVKEVNHLLRNLLIAVPTVETKIHTITAP